MVWVGDNRNKGLAIFGFGPWKLQLDPSFDDRLQWIAPIRVEGPRSFNLIAVWAKNHRAKVFHPAEPQKRQPAQAAAVYRSFIGERDTICAGDFNSNVRWDTARSPSFRETAEAFEDLGLRSAYHSYQGCAFGEEEPTLYWQTRTIDGRSYHIDYCFVPEHWCSTLRSVEVGRFDEWVGAGFSDHVPLIVETSD